MNSSRLYALILATTVLDRFHLVLASQDLVGGKRPLNSWLLPQGGSALMLWGPADGTFTFCVQLFHASSQKPLSQEEFLPSYPRSSLWESVREKKKIRKGRWRISSSMTSKWFSCSDLKTHLLKGDQDFPISPHPKSGYRLSSQDTSLLFFQFRN